MMKKPILYILMAIMAATGLTSYVLIAKNEHANPLKNILDNAQEDKLPMFVVLYNMDVEGWSETRPNNAKFRHQYKVVTNADNPRKMKVRVTQFLPVNQEMFFNHYHNLDMQIASKTASDQGNQVSLIASPLGYAHYVGNKKMGKWINKGEQTIWKFKRRYRNLARICNTRNFSVSKTRFMHYFHNYRERQVYYGNNDEKTQYGTGSSFSRQSRRTSPFYDDDRESKVRAFYKYQSRIGRNGKNIRSRSGNTGK